MGEKLTHIYVDDKGKVVNETDPNVHHQLVGPDADRYLKEHGSKRKQAAEDDEDAEAKAVTEPAENKARMRAETKGK